MGPFHDSPPSTPPLPIPQTPGPASAGGAALCTRLPVQAPQGPTPTHTRRALWAQAVMHFNRGRYPPPPPRSSLCPATVPLTPSASFNGICNR